MNKKIKIDLVYLYVDGNDSAHKQKKMLWAEKLNIPYNNGDEYRDIDNEELRYSIRSVIKNAPWINKIYVVNDNQIPKWLDLTKSDKIEIINHSDFIPEKYLPTFNSDVIESFIADIPGLSEYFLYANDDCFIHRPVKPCFFFDENGTPIVRLKEKTRTLKVLRESQYERNIFHTINLVKKKYCKLYNHTSQHNIDAYTKSDYKNCVSEFQKEFDKLRENKFRSSSIQRIIFSLYTAAKKNAKVEIVPINPGRYEHKDSLYINIKQMNTLQKDIISRTPYLLCINDTPTTPMQEREDLKNFLEVLYPKRQIWEKKDSVNIDKMKSRQFKNLYTKNLLIMFFEKCAYNIFSISNETQSDIKYKVIRILGFKIKFKSRKGINNG